jgi:hypothetical protein
VTDLYITDEAELLAKILAKLDRIDALLTEFEPILRAYLDPATSGPVAWAVRRQMGKNNGKS